MLPPNLHYADSREVVIGNSRIGFSNWRPEFNLDWVNGKLDVLFTHATISYSSNDLYKSQILDETKFDLAICGDIHKPGTKGKYVSIGTPQKCKMSDTDTSTGVIFDCDTKAWKWVDLDPGQKLMKFQYTPLRDAEGWDSSTGVWNVYKPDNFCINSGVRDIKVPAWEEIGNLIDDIIMANDLGVVHGEVLKNIKNLEAKEVDFNFTLLRFYCKNWRSIDEVELYFSEGDKILITGKNGSGKSSLLTALRYAFVENRFMKDFIQFGSSSCVTEVDFLYQGNTFKIQRGTKKYGLWINSEPQKYNNKREFEDDVRLRFPFIDYMDIYFFDADHHKLIGGITPERKSEIISKFFKMDKIDAFNEEAEDLLSQFTKSTYKWKEEIETQDNLIIHLDQKMNLIPIPSRSKLELESIKAEGFELQRKSKVWNDYQILSATLNANVQSLEKEIQSIKVEVSKERNMSMIDNEIQTVQGEISKINSSLSELNDVSGQYNLKLNEKDKILTKGNKLYAEWESLGIDKACKMCGQVIQSKEQLQKHRSEVEEKMKSLELELNTIELDLNGLEIKKNEVFNTKRILSDQIQELNSKVSILMMEKRQNQERCEKLKNITHQLELTNKKLVNSLGTKPEEIILPDDFLQIMNQIEQDIVRWNNYNDLCLDKINAVKSKERAKQELDELISAMSELQRYIKITGPTGKIYEEIMTKLAEQFSDNQVKYEVVTYNFRKKDHLDLASYFHNNGNWVAYQACSSGQRTVLDVNFLSKVVTRVGILVMDEFLKHLDPFNHDICIESIRTMNIGCTLLSSHMESIVSFNNKSCQLSLNESGITNIILQ